MSPTVLNRMSTRMSWEKALYSQVALVISVLKSAPASAASARGAHSGATNRSTSLEQRGRPRIAEARPPISRYGTPAPSSALTASRRADARAVESPLEPSCGQAPGKAEIMVGTGASKSRARMRASFRQTFAVVAESFVEGSLEGVRQAERDPRAVRVQPLHKAKFSCSAILKYSSSSPVST